MSEHNDTSTTWADEELADVELKDDRLNRRCQEVAVGGIHLEIVGLIWLTFGVLGASIPDVIAALWATLVR